MRSKATLWANSDLVKRSIEGDVVTLSNKLSSINDPLLHVLLVLKLGELASDNAQNDVLVGGQGLERFETTGAGGVVLEVVGVDVQLLEELNSNTVVATFGEVPATDKVTAAEMNTDVHIGGQVCEAVVVLLDILLEHGIGGVYVQRVLLEASEELIRAEV